MNEEKPMLLPTQACFRPGEPVVLELSQGAADRTLTVEHLGRQVAAVPVPAGAPVVEVPPLASGGYAVTLHDRAATPATAAATCLANGAVEVAEDPLARLRYGFVAHYPTGRDPEPVVRWFRRLHLTACQFYDWGWRHADLVAPGPDYTDPLGQPVSLPTVRAMADRLREAAVAPIGYAAVYGVGEQEWPRWQHAALLRPDGTPYRLGDFLSLVDPADEGWLEHLTQDLLRATASGGFAGFHLDQYGYPWRAVCPDGRRVDVAAAFDAMIRAVRRELPDAKLIFNNVNDFPVWTTADSPQDATYTEVWSPHDRLADLAAVATRARTLAPHRPAVVAAYQSLYREADSEQADRASSLTMATLFSHGATQLLAGEDGRVLVDPYYVHSHPATAGTRQMLARWYDLLVAAGDVLMAPGLADITRSVVGHHNDELDVHAPAGIRVSHEPAPGAVWRRVVSTPHGLVVHLINLTGVAETGWDTPKATQPRVSRLRLRMRRVGSGQPTVRWADPDRGPQFRPLPVRVDGEHANAELPPLGLWQLLMITY